MLKKILGVAVVAILAGFASVSTVRADTLTVDDVLFTGTVTSTQATLTVQCTNVSVCGSFFLGDVTLKGFTDTTAVAGPTIDGGYTFKRGGQNNDAVATGGGCNGKDKGGAVCWDAPTTLDQLGTTTFTFTSTLTGGATSGPLHLQATAYNNSSGIGTHGDKVFAISSDLNGGVITTTPEPMSSSLLLLGIGLLALPLGLRKKFASVA